MNNKENKEIFKSNESFFYHCLKKVYHSMLSITNGNIFLSLEGTHIIYQFKTSPEYESKANEKLNTVSYGVINILNVIGSLFETQYTQ